MFLLRIYCVINILTILQLPASVGLAQVHPNTYMIDQSSGIFQQTLIYYSSCI